MTKEGKLHFVCILVLALASYAVISKDVFTKAKVDGGTPYGCNTEDITRMYEGYIEEWKSGIKLAFNQAEKEIFKDDNPTPDVLGPHPDPDKCICGGSGIIVHGDGHKTVCPYHGKKKTSKIGPVLKSNGLIIHNY
tara:strand:+ start:672 stop:1079 length:408 start_codon:yes stop_codon:yes gene_type:complete